MKYFQRMTKRNLKNQFQNSSKEKNESCENVVDFQPKTFSRLSYPSWIWMPVACKCTQYYSIIDRNRNFLALFNKQRKQFEYKYIILRLTAHSENIFHFKGSFLLILLTQSLLRNYERGKRRKRKICEVYYGSWVSKPIVRPVVTPDKASKARNCCDKFCTSMLTPFWSSLYLCQNINEKPIFKSIKSKCF